MKCSELLAKPLLSLAEGELLGDIRACVLNADRTRLIALECADGYLLAADATVGESAVLVRSRERIRKDPPKEAASGLSGLELYTADGGFCGTIDDLIFDEKNRLIQLVAEGVAYDRALLLSVGETAAVLCESPERLRAERRKLSAGRNREPSSEKKASTAFSYLIGRKVIAPVYNQRGEMIVKSGTRVSLNTLRVCKNYGKLVALARNCKA